MLPVQDVRVVSGVSDHLDYGVTCRATPGPAPRGLLAGGPASPGLFATGAGSTGAAPRGLPGAIPLPKPSGSSPEGLLAAGAGSTGAAPQGPLRDSLTLGPGTAVHIHVGGRAPSEQPAQQAALGLLRRLR